jgi:REP element-mobilizing transposase RayT
MGDGANLVLRRSYPIVPRKPREELAGGVHHVYARGNNREPIFGDDGDCQVYLVILRGVIAVYGWRLLSYCLMTNHVHLIVETPYPNLGAGVQRLHGHYGRHFNRRYGRSGHVFKRPYGVSRIKDDVQFLTAVSYVAFNPVAADLCSRPEDWLRSSHAETLGLRSDEWVDVGRLLHYLEAWGGNALQTYAAAVGARN